MRRHSLALLTLLPAAAVTAQAQDEPRREPRVFTFTMPDGGGTMRMFDSRRGRIGIRVSLEPSAARDSIGAHVQDVDEGGPADRAGVRSGDLVVRMNGVRLAEGRSDEDEWRSRPAQRLLNLASRLEPGDTVRLELRRGTDTRNLVVVTDSADMDRIVERMRLPMREFMGPGGPGTFEFGPGMGQGGRMRVMVSGPGFSDLELIRVTPALAEGLGIQEGLLVTRVGADTALGVREGDVITAIGGRRPTSPSHAMRILSTYEPGEAVQLDVMRRGRRTSVNGRLPQARTGEWRAVPNHWEMELPRFPAELRRFLEDEAPELRLRVQPRMRMRTPDGRTDELMNDKVKVRGEVRT